MLFWDSKEPKMSEKYFKVFNKFIKLFSNKFNEDLILASFDLAKNEVKIIIIKKKMILILINYLFNYLLKHYFFQNEYVNLDKSP